MKAKKTLKKATKKAPAKKQPPKVKVESAETKELKIQIDALKEQVKSQKETISRLRKRNKSLSEKVAKKDSSFPVAPVTPISTNAGTDSAFLTKIAVPTPETAKPAASPESPFSTPVAPTKTVLDTDLSTFRAPCIQDADKDPGASLMMSVNPLANACAVKY